MISIFDLLKFLIVGTGVIYYLQYASEDDPLSQPPELSVTTSGPTVEVVIYNTAGDTPIEAYSCVADTDDGTATCAYTGGNFSPSNAIVTTLIVDVDTTNAASASSEDTIQGKNQIMSINLLVDFSNHCIIYLFN